ncbi:hypothetical protein [Streptomyces sp. SBT349]|uniref:hypothetical protein n=1 Tax=Streptomyces sp. SBT349 TaxID=1580539 RepID=UPI00066C2B9A|nr:hypothetical protein [Streptomyces sp. SBT349]
MGSATRWVRPWARPAIVAGAAALLALTTATTAWAATAQVGANMAEAGSNWMRAYDGETDGRGVYADAYLTDGRHVSVWDGNGHDGTWGPKEEYSPAIARFRVCEDKGSCSDWKYL